MLEVAHTALRCQGFGWIDIHRCETKASVIGQVRADSRQDRPVKAGIKLINTTHDPGSSFPQNSTFQDMSIGTEVFSANLILSIPG